MERAGNLFFIATLFLGAAIVPSRGEAAKGDRASAKAQRDPKRKPVAKGGTGLAKDGQITVLPIMSNLVDGKVRDLLTAKGVRVEVADRHWVSRLPETRRALKELEGPVVLTGYSHGGRVAMRLAHEFPDKVVGLVLMAPQVKTLHAAWKQRFGEPLPGFEAFKERGGRDVIRAHNDLDIREDYDEHAQETGIKIPVLIFHGLSDGAISHHYVRRVATENGPVKAYLLKGQGHYVTAPFMAEKIAEMILKPKAMMRDAAKTPVEEHDVPFERFRWSRFRDGDGDDDDIGFGFGFGFGGGGFERRGRSDDFDSDFRFRLRSRGPLGGDGPARREPGELGRSLGEPKPDRHLPVVTRPAVSEGEREGERRGGDRGSIAPPAREPERDRAPVTAKPEAAPDHAVLARAAEAKPADVRPTRDARRDEGKPQSRSSRRSIWKLIGL